jgi:short subunit dehydrogenase-like uncharacterized protein
MILVYGVTGYTGRLIAERACRRGLDVVVAGRNAERVGAIAKGLGVSHRAFDVDDARGLAGASVVLNCAGPFVETASRLSRACIAAKVHYLDLAGEVAEIEAVRSLDEVARAAGAMLMPAVGFGVVPTDCVAALLAAKVPGATWLSLAFQTVGGVSRGTLRTVLTDVHRDGVARRDGRLVPMGPGVSQRRIDLGAGETTVVTNPWRGDLVTAYSTTKIPNIDTFTAFPPPVRWLMSAGWLLDQPIVQRILTALVARAPEGPSDAERAKGRSYVWGEVRDDGGRRAVACLEGPEAYEFTAQTAVDIAARVARGEARPGFQTPAGMFGASIVEADNVRIRA